MYHEKKINLNKKHTRDWWNMFHIIEQTRNHKWSHFISSPSYQIICDSRDFIAYIFAGQHLAPDSCIYIPITLFTQKVRLSRENIITTRGSQTRWWNNKNKCISPRTLHWLCTRLQQQDYYSLHGRLTTSQRNTHGRTTAPTQLLYNIYAWLCSERSCRRWFLAYIV